jgi:hypothetical protein
VPTDIAGDFTTAGGMADMDCILQIKRRGEFGEIVGIGVEVVAIPGLARAAMTASVMCDAAIACDFSWNEDPV